MKIQNNRKFLYPALAGMVAIVALVAYFLFSAVSTQAETFYVYIDSDDTQDSVFAKIAPKASPMPMAGLTTLLRHTDYSTHVHTGRYAVNPKDGALRLFRRLRNGQQSSMRLTIPEARTMERLAELLSRKLMIDSASIAQALTSEETCRKYGYDTCSVTAMFVPDTYEVYWDISTDALLQRMAHEHDRFWQGDRTEKAKARQLTPVEVATLASIIDEETANTAEKPMIAGMYLNRLKTGMPLQADPTVKFALRQFGLRRIYTKQTRFQSPYNTYANEGLPPGPIKIASVKGIDAVLNAVDHDFLYMCAKEDFSGTHNFARTYADHLKNAARYSKALNERGIQ